MTEKTTPNRPLIEQKLEYFGNEIQHLMSDYPCLREICKGLETAAYPAALFTGACFLGTLMTRCTYRFYHRPEELRRLNYGVYIIGDPGSGKSFATRLYDLLGCRGIVRFDFIYNTEEQELYFLEVNTIPGQSAESIVPKQARAMGITPAELYEMSIQAALQ